MLFYRGIVSFCRINGDGWLRRRRSLESGLRGLCDRDDGVFPGDVDHRAKQRHEAVDRPIFSAPVRCRVALANRFEIVIGCLADSNAPRYGRLRAARNERGKSPRGGGMLADDQAPVDPKNMPKSGGLRKRSGVMLNEIDPAGTGAMVQFESGTTELVAAAKQTLDALLPSLDGRLNKIEIRGQVEISGAGGGVARRIGRGTRSVATVVQTMPGSDEIPGAKWHRPQAISA